MNWARIWKDGILIFIVRFHFCRVHREYRLHFQLWSSLFLCGAADRKKWVPNYLIIELLANKLLTQFPQFLCLNRLSSPDKDNVVPGVGNMTSRKVTTVMSYNLSTGFFSLTTRISLFTCDFWIKSCHYMLSYTFVGSEVLVCCLPAARISIFTIDLNCEGN